MIHYLTFAGKSSRDFGVFISGAKTFGSGTRDFEQISIPGRNGDLLFDNGRFKNVKVSYEAYIVRDFNTNYNAFNSWLMSQKGYARLEDTYQPDFYRLAFFSAGLQSEPDIRLGVGAFKIEFNCKPQKFLKSGEIPVKYMANGTIYNPTMYTSEPLITLKGTPGASGAFNIKSNQTINFKFPASGTIIVDSAIGEAYDTDGTNLNNSVSFPASNTEQYFPKISPGENAVLLWNVASVEIIPRWWQI